MDDEDVSSDEAFNSEDERQFGGAFKAGKRDSQYDDDAQSDAGEVEGEKETISALFSSITHNGGDDDCSRDRRQFFSHEIASRTKYDDRRPEA